jgi:hypothetical protein
MVYEKVAGTQADKPARSKADVHPQSVFGYRLYEKQQSV